MSTFLIRWRPILLVGVLGIIAPCLCMAAVECPTESLFVDPVSWTNSMSAMWGQAPGETFVAEDTLISAITVWRYPSQTGNNAPLKLWIVEVDSSGRPMADKVVLDGPVIQVFGGDGIHPIEIRFGLGAPAVLPRRGKFAFFVQNICYYFFRPRAP